MFNLPLLLLVGIAYLLLLFGAAYLTERGILPNKIIRHPLTHVLSLGVYASVWTFYGAFGLAHESGYSFLGSYFGAVIMFLLGPAILIPILRITRTYQLSSLPDLFAFRFKSASIGILTTIVSVIATLPMLSIQIQAVTDALYMLNDQFSEQNIGLGFCFVIALFSILFGARKANLRNSHQGLMVAMAVESLIKLLALLLVAGYAIFAVFDGPAGVQSYINSNPEVIKQLEAPVDSESWRTLLVVFFASAIVMPHMFHMLFTENSSDETIYKATWVMPLFLFLLAAAVPPVLWAGDYLQISGEAQFIILNLGLSLDSHWLTIVAFIGGLSAASGIMIVATVSMASMIQNHLVLPLVSKPQTQRFYAWLLWLRRLLIIAMLLASYLFYAEVGAYFKLHHMGILAVVAFLQFLPGLLCTLFWQRASRWGMICGLVTGISVWLLGMFLPLFTGSAADLASFNLENSNWDNIAILSVLLNTTVLAVVSLLSSQSPDEFRAAQACLLNALEKPSRNHLRVSKISDFIDLLAAKLGRKAAEREVKKALDEMNLPTQNVRPIDLLRLRTLLEQNLSGLLGPVEAAALLEPLDRPSDPLSFRASNVPLMEDQLENYQEQLTGLAAELDEMRRYHRLTLQKLPTGVCTLDIDGQVLFWNNEMERLTAIAADSIIGSNLGDSDNPWGQILHQFSHEALDHQLNQTLQLDDATHWFSLHKTMLKERRDIGMVILLEDETATKNIQDKLTHHERLASIGRFAAGVAHEIGNPVTGIACLAQNLKLETDNTYILETGDQIVDQTKRISRIVQSLVRFAHTGKHDMAREHVAIVMADCAQEAIQLLSLDSQGKQINYHNNISADIQVEGDPQLLQQVMLNLLRNAADASQNHQSIWLDAEIKQHRVEISITDEGSGIPTEAQSRAFEPFYTTKEPGQGTGLGLPLVYNIIEEHYGSIELVSPAKNKQKKGTQVIITLPRLESF